MITSWPDRFRQNWAASTKCSGWTSAITSWPDRFPTNWPKLAILEFLSLSQNQLTGCVPEGLRDVANSDLDELDLPFCDVLLSGLTVSPGSLITQFDPYQTDYTAAAGLSLVTVIPTNEHDATFLFLDETDSEVEDADNTLIGHQIDFGADLTTLRIRVVSQDDRATLTYTVVDLGSTYDADNNEVIGQRGGHLGHS